MSTAWGDADGELAPAPRMSHIASLPCGARWTDGAGFIVYRYPHVAVLAIVREDAPRRVLARHHPGVPIYADVTTTDWDAVEPVDIITAGYPCQPFSVAGKRKGTNDARHLVRRMDDGLPARHRRRTHSRRGAQGARQRRRAPRRRARVADTRACGVMCAPSRPRRPPGGETRRPYLGRCREARRCADHPRKHNKHPRPTGVDMHHRITPLARRAAIVCALTISIAGCTYEHQRVTRIEHQWRCANTPAAETRCAR